MIPPIREEHTVQSFFPEQKKPKLQSSPFPSVQTDTVAKLKEHQIGKLSPLEPQTVADIKELADQSSTELKIIKGFHSKIQTRLSMVKATRSVHGAIEKPVQDTVGITYETALPLFELATLDTGEEAVEHLWNTLGKIRSFFKLQHNLGEGLRLFYRRKCLSEAREFLERARLTAPSKFLKELEALIEQEAESIRIDTKVQVINVATSIPKAVKSVWKMVAKMSAKVNVGFLWVISLIGLAGGYKAMKGAENGLKAQSQFLTNKFLKDFEPGIEKDAVKKMIAKRAQAEKDTVRDLEVKLDESIKKFATNPEQLYPEIEKEWFTPFEGALSTDNSDEIKADFLKMLYQDPTEENKKSFVKKYLYWHQIKADLVKSQLVDLAIKKQNSIKDYLLFTNWYQTSNFLTSLAMSLVIATLAVGALFTTITVPYIAFSIASLAFCSIGIFYWLKNKPHTSLVILKNYSHSFYYNIRETITNFQRKLADYNMANLKLKLLAAEVNESLGRKTAYKSLREAIVTLEGNQEELQRKAEYWRHKNEELEIEMANASLKDLGYNFTLSDLAKQIKDSFFSKKITQVVMPQERLLDIQNKLKFNITDLKDKQNEKSILQALLKSLITTDEATLHRFVSSLEIVIDEEYD